MKRSQQLLDGYAITLKFILGGHANTVNLLLGASV